MAEFNFAIEGNAMRCKTCGHTVIMDEYYDLRTTSGKHSFRDIDQWYKWQRGMVREEVQKEGFCLEAPVYLRTINLWRLKKDLDTVGQGTLKITNHEITYTGTKDGGQVALVFDIKLVPSISFSPKTRSVDLFYKTDHYNFKPLEHSEHTVKWMLATEEIHNLYDPAWKQASDEVYELVEPSVL